MTTRVPFRVGVLGFGKLGRFIAQQIISSESEHNIQLVFVWNRSLITDGESVFCTYQRQTEGNLKNNNILNSSSASATTDNDTGFSNEEKSPNNQQQPLIFERLEQIATLSEPVDLIVEVCHPEIVRQYGTFALENANFLIGSPVALMSDNLREQLLISACAHKKRIFVGTGALWGSADIRRLAKLSLLDSAEIQMKFSPKALRLTNLECSDVKVEQKKSGEIHFSGSVRQLAKIAPNNVNTMACLALSGLGPDKTQGTLISDENLTGFHQIIVTVKGKPQKGFKDVFQNVNERLSPTATESNVTSQQTFYSFWYSILEAKRLLLSSQLPPASSLEIEII